MFIGAILEQPGIVSAMARIVLATFGSLGDLHPVLALAFELRRRGHAPEIECAAF